MNKKASAITILVLVLLIICLTPLVSATSETFSLPRRFTIDLKHGDTFSGYMTVSGNPVNDTFKVYYADLGIFNPRDNRIALYEKTTNKNFTFSALFEGTYILYFWGSSDETVRLDYDISSSNTAPANQEWNVIVIVGVAIVILACSVFGLVAFTNSWEREEKARRKSYRKPVTPISLPGNKIFARKTSPKATCLYCGAKNHATDANCFYCGAPLKVAK